MPLTTSYFAVADRLDGTKISIARFNPPRMVRALDETIAAFAPSISLLHGYKRGRIDWGEYVRRYTKEQRDHYLKNREDFDRLLDRAEDEKIVLLCYERFEGTSTKCHRFLLYDILKKVAKKDEFDVEFIDERSPNRKSQ